MLKSKKHLQELFKPLKIMLFFESWGGKIVSWMRHAKKIRPPGAQFPNTEEGGHFQ